MQARAAVTVGTLAGAVLLAGCTHAAPDASASRSPSSGTRASAPALGGDPSRPVTPPRRAMDRLERPVAERLARQVTDEGLTLSYLDCPPWDGTVPAAMTCRGYLDGVVGLVRVDLHAAVMGRAVGFRARLTRGVIATRVLERTLRDRGATGADCGPTVAYPARVGARITCRVTRGGADRYVVATVADRTGAVTISDYARAGTRR